MQLITEHKDFPKKGILFKDLLPILQHPDVFSDLIEMMSSYEIFNGTEAIIAIDARGFIFGTAISIKLSKPMIVARKPGKLPGDLFQENYSLEYGENSLSIQKLALKKFDSYVIVDDLLATGGTVDSVARILLKSGKKITGLLTIMELLELNGRSKLDFPVESILQI